MRPRIADFVLEVKMVEKGQNVAMVEKMKAENISPSSVCFTNLKEGWDAHKLRRGARNAGNKGVGLCLQDLRRHISAH